MESSRAEAIQLADPNVWRTSYQDERTMADHSQWANRSVTHLLHKAEQAATKLFATNALGFITPRQLAVLVAIAENEGLNQTDVTKRTGIGRASLSEIIPRLKRKGLLQRRRSPKDTRAKVLRLTDEGRLLLKTATPLERNVDALLLAVLPAAERRSFLAALQAIVRNLEAGR
jgi:MarR family transcriptional regulator, temperature-dependent positive regulator of motility